VPLQTGQRLQVKERSPSSSVGFALVEILVGLAIMSLVLLAAMRGMGLAVNTQADVAVRQAALWSADNTLVQLRAQRAWPGIGTSVTPCSQAQWILVCELKVLPTPNPLFRRVEVNVFAANPETPDARVGPRLAGLVTIIPNDAGGFL
jgi:general secretion pathway protein I